MRGTVLKMVSRENVMQARVSATALAASFFLVGCGSTYSLKEFSPADGAPKTAFIDIKQRAILSGAPPASAPGVKRDVIMCAEPSPDALSSLASELALDAKYKDTLTTSLGFSQQEAASFVGLRTQTIQLLRDGMYRLCEGYLSGAFSPADFAWLSRRYQRNMVALLTIEQLTRVAQAPTVAHASQGLASASRSATAIQGDLEEIDKTKARLEDEKKKLTDEKAEVEKLADTDTAKPDKLKDVQKRLDDKQGAITRTEEIRSALLEGLKTAKGLLASGATTVQIVTDTRDTRATHNADVVQAIRAITSDIINQDDLPTLCFQLLDGSRSAANAAPELKTACATLVTARANLELRSLQLRIDDGKQSNNEPRADSIPKPGGATFLNKILNFSEHEVSDEGAPKPIRKRASRPKKSP